MTTAVHPNPGLPNPRGRHGSLPNVTPAYQGPQRLTLAKFVTEFSKEFPAKFVVCKGFYGPSEDLKFSEGDQFIAHSLTQSTVVNIEYENGQRENIAVNKPIPFAILFNPHDNISEAIRGYKYEKVSELIQLPILPPVLWSRKAYSGSSPESSVAANELLIVRGVKTRIVGRQQLKVYSLTQRKEKTLSTSCTGSFTTRPRDISLYLPDILKHMPDIFPCRAVMFNDDANQLSGKGIPKSVRTGASVVTLMHSSINTSVSVSSALGHCFSSSRTRFLDVPIDLNIMVRKDNSVIPVEDSRKDGIYEDTSMYDQVRPNGGHERALTNHHSQPNRTDSMNQQGNSQFYTNVHFGQDCPQRRNTNNQVVSVERAIETGHYQTPQAFKERTSSDPIAIDSVYHPPDDAPPGYVFLSKSGNSGNSAGSSGSTGSYGSNPQRAGGPGSWERGSPSSRNSSNDNISMSPSYRPPLPPPNKTRKNHRSPGYSYVETNPTRSTQVYEGQNGRTQAKHSSDSGVVLPSPHPEGANSTSSFGSSGSGGAIVERRSSVGHVNRMHSHPGSGDGIVERSMRSSSISSQGYSYAKTNAPLKHAPQSDPRASADKPLSPHHYSHLRSNSGPTISPQLLPLSAQIKSQQFPGPHPQQQQQPPVTMTRLDDESDSIVVIQRHSSVPAMSLGTASSLGRKESTLDMSESRGNKFEGTNETDELILALDDLAKITQELDENIFPQDMNSSPLPNEEAPDSRGIEFQATPTIPSTTSSIQGTDVAEYPPDVIDKNRKYLKAMDNYQILNMLERMGLEQYTPIFKQEQINGDILSTCDDALLKDELKVTSRLHRMRLLRVIAGTYCVHEIMSGKDGYIFMTSAGKQQ